VVFSGLAFNKHACWLFGAADAYVGRLSSQNALSFLQTQNGFRIFQKGDKK